MENAYIVPVLFFALTLIISYVVLFRNKRNNNENKPRLPPGSLGLPYIGETLKLYSQSPSIFYSDRQRRYGNIFKTSILGYPSVMLATPEAARVVLINKDNLFKPTYPKSKENLIGPSAVFFHEGDYHTRIRKLIQGSFNPGSIRNMTPGIEKLIVSALNSWAVGGLISTFSEMKKLSFEVGILAIFGHLEPHYSEELKKNYIILDKGYNSFPINLPGTKYHKALKARKRLSEILNNITSERRKNKVPDDEKNLLSCMLNFKDEILSEDQIADNIIGVLFAAQDTTASAMTWIVKYLYDNPEFLEIVKAEQKGIYQSNHIGRTNLTWDQTKSNMPFTNKVINESLRMASIISFTFREAVADVEIEGYHIPKGWKVMPLFRNIHHNPIFFPEPQKFDPNRFENHPIANTYMPFGNGVHNCPGNEIAKLEMLILVHHLASSFSYEVVDTENRTEYSPFPVPFNGLQAQYWKEE